MSESSMELVGWTPELASRHPHGVRIRYMGGCRCLQCRMANSNYEKERRLARTTGDWNGIVDTAAARAHIKKLARKGVGYKMVAAAASVNKSIVFAIKNGRRPNARARTVRSILAVTPDVSRGDAALVPAASTWRLINLLLEEGYTKGMLAKLLGRQRAALQIRKVRVTLRTREEVRALYRRLMT
jgi:hypothetical protein